MDMNMKYICALFFAAAFLMTGCSSDTGTAVQCSDIQDATRIYNSSTAVIHLIDRPLLYNKELSDKYNEISGY